MARRSKIKGYQQPPGLYNVTDPNTKRVVLALEDQLRIAYTNIDELKRQIDELTGDIKRLSALI